MKERKSRWMSTMIEKYGSEEAVKAEMSRRQKKSRENYSGMGGFRSLDKERLIEITKQGAAARWRKDVPGDN